MCITRSLTQMANSKTSDFLRNLQLHFALTAWFRKSSHTEGLEGLLDADGENSAEEDEEVGADRLLRLFAS